MSGRTIETIYPQIDFNPGEIVLDLQNVSTRSGVRNASITARRGEIVGLAGLLGCGKSELLRAAYGLELPLSGKVYFKGDDHTQTTPRCIANSGFFYLPPDRKSEGLVLEFNGSANITLSSLANLLFDLGGWLWKREAKNIAIKASEEVQLTNRVLSKAVGLLSGGNQQKVLFAKGLTRSMDLYVFDEPTVGVDIGTRTALYEVIKKLCEGGAAVVLISSDLPEVLNLAHRAYVMSVGEVMGELKQSEITESSLLSLFFHPREGHA
jgi:ribose transport system ATP-binding protein